jgi:hypothetical protein
VPHLEPYPHHRGPLDVVRLGEGWPPTAGTDVPDNGLDPMVTMVPVRGGRAAPPVKTAINVNPAAGGSAPVWAAAAVCSRVTSLASLSSLPLSSSVETELSVLLAHRALSSAAAARAASAVAAASTSALAAASSVIASLVALAAVAAVSTAATSASCRCCVLEATER